MADTHTQEEVRAEYIAKMGPDLGELQYLLWHDVTGLHLKWVDRISNGQSADKARILP